MKNKQLCVALPLLNKTAIFIARYLRPWRGNKYFLEVFGFMAFLTLQLCDLCWCYFSQEQLNNFWPKKNFSTKIFSLHEMFFAEFVWCLLFILNLVHKRTSAKIAPQGQNGERKAYEKSERPTIECQKTKSREITTANQNRGKKHNAPMKSQNK